MLKVRLMSLTLLLGLLLASLSIYSPKVSALSGSEFQAGRIMDDIKFFTSNSPMSIGDIQNFLNAKVPVCDTNGSVMIYDSTHGDTVTRAVYSQRRGVNTPFTCLKDYRENTNSKPAEAALCNEYIGSNHSAAEIIYYVGTNCGINPQVLLVLLQKEQSLITDDWPWPVQYRSATGYGCPDTAPCDAEYYGFFNQVYNAARQFKRYARDPQLFNYRPNTNSNILYNPNVSCGSSAVFIQNQATAGLYNYTPYQPNASALNNLYGSGDSCGAYGNRNFWRMFNDWFGSTFGPPDYSCKFSTNVGGAGRGDRIVANKFTATGPTLLTLSMLNHTGSACMEMHTWDASQQGWAGNVATNHPAINPSNGEIISGNLFGDSRSELIFVAWRFTGSNKIEIHTWDSDYQHWLSNTATNHPLIDAFDTDVIAGDVNGDGRDELLFIRYRNTESGRIEVHTWGPNQQSWVSNIATNHPQVNPGDVAIISGNLYGDRKDELILVRYRNTESGRIEVHTWLPDQQSWFNNVATNHPVIDPVNAQVVATDSNGDGRDELALVLHRNTGSNRIEVHTWLSEQQGWFNNVATNHPTL